MNYTKNSRDTNHRVEIICFVQVALDKALPLALQAETLFQKSKSPDLAIAHDLLLKTYYTMHNIPKAKEYLALCKKDKLEIDPEIEKALN